MAKITNLRGIARGKIGSTVIRVSHGVMVAGEYQPVVANPNTMGQRNARARFKLMSQLAAVMAPYAVFPREGLVSPRNKFIKANYSGTVASDGDAAAALLNMQFANGTLAPVDRVVITREQEMTQFDAYTNPEVFDSVVLVAFTRENDGSLSPFVAEAMSLNNPSGETYNYHYEWAPTAKEVFAYVYGVKFNTAADRANYENYIVGGNTEIANLLSANIITATNSSFSKTKGAHLDATAAEYNVQVYSSNVNHGTVAKSVDGETHQVTLTATAKAGYVFAGWRVSGSQQIVSTDNPYTFLPNHDETYWGIFLDLSPDE